MGLFGDVNGVCMCVDGFVWCGVYVCGGVVGDGWFV